MYREADVEMMESSAHVYKQASDKYTKIRYLWLAQVWLFTSVLQFWHQCTSQCLISNQTARADIQVLGRW